MAVSYDAATRTYTVSTGTSTSVIQNTINQASSGSIIRFAAGTHTLTDTLTVTRSDITIQGAGKSQTTLLFKFSGDPGHSIHVKGSYTSWSGELRADASQNARTIELKSTSGLKVGDILHIQQENTRSWLDANDYDNVSNTDMKYPINETLVEIASISGNKVTLKTPITHDIESTLSTVKVVKPVENVTLEDFKITYSLGTPNPDDMDNAKPEYSRTISIYMDKTQGAEIEDVDIINAPSHGIEFRTSLTPHVNNITIDGAHNKGGDGNGYGIQVAETYYGVFENLTINNTRHAFVFSSWHTEVGNTVHITSTNRDINFHGGPDYNNTVTVDRDVYRSGEDIWRLVSPGGSMHPYTDLDDNTVLFGIASASAKPDVIHGWNSGAWLNGGAGKDTIYGGAGNDTLIGGADNDTLTGGAGRDKFAFKPNEGVDTIKDFKAGSNGDYIVLNGFSGVSSFSAVTKTQKSDGTHLIVGGKEIAILQGVSASSLVAGNFIFNDSSVFTIPSGGSTTTPPPTEPVPTTPPPPTSGGSGLVANLSSKVETVTGTSGNDLLQSYSAQCNTGDTINLGAGYDTLHILSTSITLDTSLYSRISGIDNIDVTAANTKAKIILDQRFLDASDNDRITITFGSKGLGGLDTSHLNSGEYEVAWGSGSVTVRLVDGGSSSQTPTTPPPTTTPSDPAPSNPVPSNPVDGSTYKLASKADTVTGTSGNDTVSGYSAQINSGDRINLGAGYDTLKVESTSMTLDTALYTQLSGIDHINLTGTSGSARVILDNGFLSRTDYGAVTISYGAKGLAMVDSSIINAQYDVYLRGSGNVNLSAGRDTVRVANGSTGHIHGLDGNDTLYGNDGMDFLYGDAGSDTLIGGRGADTLTGGSGADIFKYEDILDGGDTITDFTASDRLDISALLDVNGLLDTAQAVAGGYLRLSQSGSDVNVIVDTDGALGAQQGVRIATLENVDVVEVLLSNILVA